jgi:hypothetical protein
MAPNVGGALLGLESITSRPRSQAPPKVLGGGVPRGASLDVVI